MRALLFLLLTTPSACADRAPQPAETMHSGAQVPVTLPRGLTLYPGARITENTVVTRGAAQHVLVVFETGDQVAAVIAFTRSQARAAAATVTLDQGSNQNASLGGKTATGHTFVVTARSVGPGNTRVAFSAD